jgi:hypothetical protein
LPNRLTPTGPRNTQAQTREPRATWSCTRGAREIFFGAVYQASEFTDASARCLDAKQASSREPTANCNWLASHPPRVHTEIPAWRGLGARGTSLHSISPRLLRLGGVTTAVGPRLLLPPLESRSLLPFSAHTIPATAECGTLAFGDRLTDPAAAGLVERPPTGPHAAPGSRMRRRRRRAI